MRCVKFGCEDLTMDYSQYCVEHQMNYGKPPVSAFNPIDTIVPIMIVSLIVNLVLVILLFQKCN